MILRAALGIGLVCLGMSHFPGTDSTAADNSQLRAAVLERLIDLKSEIRNSSDNPMVSDATAMSENLHRLVQRLPVRSRF